MCLPWSIGQGRRPGGGWVNLLIKLKMARYEPLSALSGRGRERLSALRPRSSREILMDILAGLAILLGLFLLCVLFIKGIEKL
ncbi:hypothetical protein [Deinococcus sp. UYEF24]